MSVVAEAEILHGAVPANAARDAEVDKVAPDIYFHAGDLDSDNAPAVCNNGWVIFEDYVLVIDANFPAGAKLMISKIRSITDSQSGSPSTHITMATTLTGTRFMWRTAPSQSHTLELSKKCGGTKPATTTASQADGKRGGEKSSRRKGQQA